jgi:hypothetical protein
LVLEHDADFAAGRRQMINGHAADHDPSQVLRDEPGDDPQQRCLAAAGRAEQGHQFPTNNAERHVVHRRLRAVAVSDAVELQRPAVRLDGRGACTRGRFERERHGSLSSKARADLLHYNNGP